LPDFLKESGVSRFAKNLTLRCTPALAARKLDGCGLSELLDLHEHGFAVQTSERLEMNRAVTLCLDLPETKSYIHGSGQVIWSDDAGRGGIRFSSLSENSRKF